MIKTENIAATYVDNITIDIQLTDGKVVSVRVYDEDIISELQTNEFFFEDQRNIDWLVGARQVVFVSR